MEGDTSAAKPRNGQTVTIHKKGEMIQIFKSVISHCSQFCLIVFTVSFQERLAIEDRDVELVVSEGEDIRCLDLVLPLMHPGEASVQLH